MTRFIWYCYTSPIIYSDVIRLQDRVGVPETTYSIAQTIRKNVRSVQQGVVTRKHIARMLQYRVGYACRFSNGF